MDFRHPWHGIRCLFRRPDPLLAPSLIPTVVSTRNTHSPETCLSASSTSLYDFPVSNFSLPSTVRKSLNLHLCLGQKCLSYISYSIYRVTHILRTNLLLFSVLGVMLLFHLSSSPTSKPRWSIWCDLLLSICVFVFMYMCGMSTCSSWDRISLAWSCQSSYACCPPVSTYPVIESHELATTPAFYVGAGIIFRSSCLHGKYFTDLSPQLLILYFFMYITTAYYPAPPQSRVCSPPRPSPSTESIGEQREVKIFTCVL